MKKKLQLIRKTQLGFAAVLAVLLAVGIVSYRSLAASAETERWVQHTHEVLEHLETLILEVTNVETGYREFALSDDQSFLQPLHTPIIALTASTTRGDREKCLASGMDGYYLTKPIRTVELDALLASHIRGMEKVLVD